MALCDYLQPGMLKESMRASSSHRETLTRPSLLLHLCMIGTTAGPKCSFHNSCILYCSNWKCYSLAPLFFILSTRQLAEVTLQLHQNFTISTQMETQLQDNVCKNPQQSVSSHCGFGKLNLHRANELVTRSGLELHQLDHDEALHARDQESLGGLEGLDPPPKPLSTEVLSWLDTN